MVQPQVCDGAHFPNSKYTARTLEGLAEQIYRISLAVSDCHLDAVSYLETRHPAILDGYSAIWTGFGGTGNL